MLITLLIFIFENRITAKINKKTSLLDFQTHPADSLFVLNYSKLFTPLISLIMFILIILLTLLLLL